MNAWDDIIVDYGSNVNLDGDIIEADKIAKYIHNMVKSHSNNYRNDNANTLIISEDVLNQLRFSCQFEHENPDYRGGINFIGLQVLVVFNRSCFIEICKL